MTKTLTDGCYCYGELIAEDITVNHGVKIPEAHIENITTERIEADVIQSDYSYSSTEMGAPTIDASINLTLNDETIQHWSDIAQYSPSLSSNKLPQFKPFDVASGLSVLDVNINEFGQGLMIVRNNDYSYVYYKSEDNGATWSYDTTAEHPMYCVEVIPNASFFAIFGNGCVERYYTTSHIYETTTIAGLTDKLPLKSIPCYRSASDLCVAWYEDAGACVCNSYGAYLVSNTSGCISGFHRLNKVWNMKSDGSFVIFPTETPNYSQTSNSTLYDLNKTWLDVSYIRETDTIIAINTTNQIIISRNGLTSIDKTITNDTAIKAHPFCGAFILSTLSGSNNWQYMIDEMKYGVNPTFETVNNPSGLLRYHYNEITRTYTATLEDFKGYRLEQLKPDEILINTFLNILYPIGSIFQSYLLVNPENLFGGKWTRLTEFLKPTTNPESIHEITGSDSHTHTTGDCTLSIEQIPTHSHWLPSFLASGSETVYILHWAPEQGAYGYGIQTGVAGGGGAHNHGDTGSASNVPKSSQLYMWMRYA